MSYEAFVYSITAPLQKRSGYLAASPYEGGGGLADSGSASDRDIRRTAYAGGYLGGMTGLEARRIADNIASSSSTRPPGSYGTEGWRPGAGERLLERIGYEGRRPRPEYDGMAEGQYVPGLQAYGRRHGERAYNEMVEHMNVVGGPGNAQALGTMGALGIAGVLGLTPFAIHGRLKRRALARALKTAGHPLAG